MKKCIFYLGKIDYLGKFCNIYIYSGKIRCIKEAYIVWAHAQCDPKKKKPQQQSKYKIDKKLIVENLMSIRTKLDGFLSMLNVENYES